MTGFEALLSGGQASTQWTLALIFDLLADRLTSDQRSKSHPRQHR